MQNTATKDRVIPLAKTILDKNYPENTIRDLGKIDPYTLKRWAEGHNSPRRISLQGICKIIAITEETLRQYLDYEISLDELWSRSGEAITITPAIGLRYDSVVHWAKTLPTNKQMQLVREILSQYNGRIIDTFPLTELQRKRLKTLALESLRYYQSNWDFFISNGVDKSLVLDLEQNFTGEYTELLLTPLAKTLFKAKQWINDDLVVIDYPKTYSNAEEMVDGLSC